ncbi:hypothetical protein ACWDSJ_13930 [Nocardia sp. NPDC003482]
MNVHEITSTCTTCEGAISWIPCPTGGWWAHEEHPADDHDATSSTHVIEEIDDHGHWITTGIENEPSATVSVTAASVTESASRLPDWAPMYEDPRLSRLHADRVAEAGAPDLTDPQHYLDQGASIEEAEMRADYALAFQMREDAARAESSSERARFAASAARMRRLAIAPEIRAEWARLDAAVTGWTQDPRAMRRQDRIDAGHADHEAPMLPIDERTDIQARELTGHAPWLTRDQSTDRRPNREDAAASPLADHAAGNAVASSLANVEREEVER